MKRIITFESQTPEFRIDTALKLNEVNLVKIRQVTGQSYSSQ